MRSTNGQRVISYIFGIIFALNLNPRHVRNGPPSHCSITFPPHLSRRTLRGPLPNLVKILSCRVFRSVACCHPRKMFGEIRTVTPFFKSETASFERVLTLFARVLRARLARNTVSHRVLERFVQGHSQRAQLISSCSFFFELCRVPISNAQDYRRCLCISPVNPLGMVAKVADTLVYTKD